MTPTDRVFVVDIDSWARRGLARLLRAVGHDVRDFASAAEVVDALGAEERGCVVLDGELLGSSDVESMARCDRLTIIVLTAGDDPETRRQAREMGVACVFRKPVDGTAIVDAINWAQRSVDSANNNEDLQER